MNGVRIHSTLQPDEAERLDAIVDELHTTRAGAVRMLLRYSLEHEVEILSWFYAQEGQSAETLKVGSLKVGDRVLSRVRPELDSRPIAAIHPSGELIKLRIGSAVTPWVPRSNYEKVRSGS
jgi:hypothetical protein